jgi:hypothetical protein
MRVNASAPASTPPLSLAPTSGISAPAGLDVASSVLGEIGVLAAQLEAGHVENESTQGVIKAAGAKLLIDHEAKLRQLIKAIKAADNKSVWQKVLTAFKIVGALAAACTGNPVALLAAALIITGVALEKTNPKAAMGLQLAGAALMVANAAGNLAGTAVLPAGATVTPLGASSAVPQYVTAGSLGGMGVSTIRVGQLGALELHADAARLRAEHRIEASQKEIAAAIEQLKAGSATTARIRAAVADLLEANQDGTRALRA